MPTTRSSTSKSASFADASTSVDLSEDSSVPSTPVDVYDLQALMLSIQANQKTIEAINNRLTEHADSLESTSKTLINLDTTIQEVCATVTEIPQAFDVKLETIQQGLRSDFSAAVASLGNNFYKDLSAHHIDTTECFKNYATTLAGISHDVIQLTKNLATVQETTLSKLDVERLVVEKWQDELDPHIKSHYDFKQETTTKLETLDRTIQDTIDGQLRIHPLLQNPRNITTRSSPNSTGFHQSTSKDFCVFKLQKELKEIKLSGDSLRDIEIFWDSILRAFTNLCQSDQAYSYYRDLSVDFTFEKHFIDPIKPPRYLPIDQAQVKRNYRSFGDALRIFLHSGTSITESTSPKAYLKLLSLCDVQDGFALLQDLVFSLSPQLLGDYHDYRSDIDALNILSGEHLSKFYQRVIKLSTEITLSNIKNGNMALLAYRFIFLLRSLQCSTITGLVMTYWSAISKHRRDPFHITKDLPWKFKDVYDDLTSSGISTLSSSIDTLSIAPTAFAARSYRSSHTMTNTKQPTSKHDSNQSTIGLHRTKDGRKFISHNNVLTPARQPSCLLCNNKHANPWHPTENCPYKHPTQILPKDVRERVMQHNALHGAKKKDYNIDQDLPALKASPPQAAIAMTTNIESTSNLSDSSSYDQNIVSPPSDLLLEEDEIIETEYFDLPLPPPMANIASIPSSDLYKDLEPDTVITDPLQYLSYES